MGSAYTESSNTEALIKALLEALQNQVPGSFGTKKDSFDETFSYERLANAMINSTPDVANTASNIKEKVSETKHKKDKKEVKAVMDTIKEQEHGKV